MTKIVTIIQARISSTRLPGKTLLPLCGEPLLVRMVERVNQSALKGKIVVATTTNPAEDSIEKICEEKKIDVFRGDEKDLLDRHYQAAKKHKADVVLKIPSDCPLICPVVIDQVIAYFMNHRDDVDYVSNLHPETFPYGNDVEVMTFEALEEAHARAQRALEREHTTPYFWENPDQFRIGNVVWESGLDFSKTHRWTIDYPEDYELIKTIFEALYPSNPAFTMEDILQFLEAHPQVAAINAKYLGTSWYQHHANELKTISKDEIRVVENTYE
jgi:spore coat polysaccharide biosynthesis protein SpsF